MFLYEFLIIPLISLRLLAVVFVESSAMILVGRCEVLHGDLSDDLIGHERQPTHPRVVHCSVLQPCSPSTLLRRLGCDYIKIRHVELIGRGTPYPDGEAWTESSDPPEIRRFLDLRIE